MSEVSKVSVTSYFINARWRSFLRTDSLSAYSATFLLALLSCNDFWLPTQCSRITVTHAHVLGPLLAPYSTGHRPHRL